MRVAVLTCVYPGVEPFVSEFVDSLVGQSCRDFTLLVLNDGVCAVDRLFSAAKFPVEIVPAGGTPARIRKNGISWASGNGFDVVVFADSDDRFAENRISRSIAALEETAVVFNDLLLFGDGWSGEVSMFSGRYAEGQRLCPASILTSNSLGLSNTAARVSVLSEAAMKTSDDTIAFDWALFTRVLAGGETALYTAQTSTYYRQHGANIASPCALDDDDILRGVTVKARHYQAVSDLGSSYRELALCFTQLESRIALDSRFAAFYCSRVRATSQQQPLWWENIRTAEELSL